MSAATKLNNSIITWVEAKDEHGETYYTDDSGRYQVYLRRGQWVACYFNRINREWDFCKKVDGQPAGYKEVQAAMKAAEDFHTSKIGVKVTQTNREDFETPTCPEKKPSVKSQSVKTSSVASAATPKPEPPAKEKDTMSTATAPTLSLERDDVLNLLKEIGWHTADQWSAAKTLKMVKSKLKGVIDSREEPLEDEDNLELVDQILGTLEDGGKLLLEGEYPEEAEEKTTKTTTTTTTVVTEETPAGEDTTPAPTEKKKRGRKPGTKMPKKAKEEAAVEPPDNLALLELCHPQELSLDELKVDRSYQRDVVEGHVKKMQKNFRPYALGALIAGEREDGTFWVVDGVQRSELLRRLGYRAYHFMVFKSQGPKHEAEEFGIINARRKGLLKTEQFSADLTAEQSEATAIAEIVEDCGFELGKATAWPKLDCVMALRKVYRKGGEELLTKLLNTLTAAWKGDKEACREFVVFGVADFMKRYENEYDHARLIEVLSKQNLAQLLATIKSSKHLFGGSRHLALGTTLLTHYNKGLKSKKAVLPNRYLGKDEEENDGPRT